MSKLGVRGSMLLKLFCALQNMSVLPHMICLSRTVLQKKLPGSYKDNAYVAEYSLLYVHILHSTGIS